MIVRPGPPGGGSTVAPSEIAAGATVRADVNYVRNLLPAGADPLTFVTEAEALSTMQTLPGRQVWIHDVRGEDTSLDCEGFVPARSRQRGPAAST